MSETDAQSATESQTGVTADADAADSSAASATHESASATRSHSIERVKPILLIAVGGFAGAVLRYASTVALPGGFPWGTIAVNVAGSFALGVLLYEARLTGRLSAGTRLLVGTGFLSSFTTYSTFAVETAALSPTLAVANVGANYALGFAAVLVGRSTVRSLVAPEVTE
jgi:CrcB protein